MKPTGGKQVRCRIETTTSKKLTKMDETQSAYERLSALVKPDPLSPINRSAGACVRRLMLAAQMSDDGIQMMRMKIARENPTLTPAEVEQRVAAWLADSPEPGFVEGWTIRNPSRFKI